LRWQRQVNVGFDAQIARGFGGKSWTEISLRCFHRALLLNY
jgi:hypothetical protein